MDSWGVPNLVPRRVRTSTKTSSPPSLATMSTSPQRQRYWVSRTRYPSRSRKRRATPSPQLPKRCLGSGRVDILTLHFQISPNFVIPAPTSSFPRKRESTPVEPSPGYEQIWSYKSTQVGLLVSINSIFHARFHFLSFFSRLIALSIDSWTSCQTSL